MHKRFALILITFAPACSDDISPEGLPPDAAQIDAEPPAPGEPDAGPPEPTFPGLVNTDEGGGVTLSEVNASSQTAWIYLDFEAMAQVDETSEAWDAAFQRYHVQLNGGASGSGNAALARLPGQAFEAVTAAPAEGFLQDSEETGLAMDAEGGWYAYDPATHELTPFDITYVLRTTEGGFIKLRFVDYYSDAGTSGYPSIRWAFLP